MHSPPPRVDRGLNIAKKTPLAGNIGITYINRAALLRQSRRRRPMLSMQRQADARTTSPSRLVPGTPLLGQDPRKPLSWWLFSTPLAKEISTGK
jgi:hypothetical protein